MDFFSPLFIWGEKHHHVMQPEGCNFLERKASKQLFLKSLSDYRTGATPSHGQPTACLKFTAAFQSSKRQKGVWDPTKGSTAAAAGDGERGSGEETQRHCCKFLCWLYFCLTAPQKGEVIWPSRMAGLWVRQTKCPHLSSEEVGMRLGGRAGRKQGINWKTNRNENLKFYYKNMKTWRGWKKKKAQLSVKMF